MQKSKKFLVILSIVVLIFTIFTVTGVVYVQNINNTLKAESYSYLKEVTQQSAKAVCNKLDGDMRMLRAMAVMLSNSGELNVPYWVDALKEEGLFGEFQRIGIILPDGRGYGKDVSGTNFSDREYFKQAMSGNYYISDVIVDRTTGILSNTYAVPVYSDGAIVGILAAVTTTDTYKQILFNKVFDGNGYTYMVKNNGDAVVRSNHPASSKDFSNLFDTIQTTPTRLLEMQETMRAGGSGTLDYTTDGNLQFLNYTPLGINEWYVVSIVPGAVVKEKSQSIISLTIISCIVVFLVFTSLILSTIYTQYRSKKALYQLAYYDDLTGIAGKNLFRMTAEGELVKNRHTYAYVILNIFRFKVINDKFGFSQGDLLLKHIAKVADAEFCGNEMASHFYADEFHILCEYHSKSELEDRLLAFSEKISAFTVATDTGYRVSMGFGVCVIERDASSIRAVGDKAGLALKRAKGNYQTSISFYNSAIRGQVAEEQEIENDMQCAIANEEFKVYLQPKYALNRGEIHGAEALVRWMHPKKGLISPDSFIPVFEKNGFITTLDMYMLDHVCRQLRTWLDQGKVVVPISINQSRLHLYDSNYITNLLHIVSKYDIPASLLELEITESAFLEDTKLLIVAIGQLHALDFKISMDDFGSGYSSLNMLQELMVDALKIDKKFFNESANTVRGKTIVSNIIAMAGDLNIQVVAEGVETVEQLDFLKQAGCNLVQGYYFARPMPVDEFEEKLDSKRPSSCAP